MYHSMQNSKQLWAHVHGGALHIHVTHTGDTCHGHVTSHTAVKLTVLTAFLLVHLHTLKSGGLVGPTRHERAKTNSDIECKQTHIVQHKPGTKTQL